jgi:P-type E1-E2 ATPase
VKHLTILSGDRDSEVQHLAEIVGITDVRASLAPEEKLKIIRDETARAPTLFLGDGINDAPAMMAATVGVAFGQNSDITAEAAGVVVLEPTLGKVDELLHIGKRMRRIALQSAIGGMILSSAGMIAAALGFLPPLAGAVGQEVIDLLAVLNAVRASVPPKELRDF